MKRYLLLKLLLTLSITFLTASFALSDWQQYLGPDRNATSKETGIKRSWGENGPEVLWTFPLGEGFGGPAISDGKVYILDRIKDKQDVLRCIDLLKGNEEWSFSYDSTGEFGYPGSRSVPTIDGDFIYTCGSFGDVYCIDKNTHQPVWHSNIWKDFDGGDKYPNWGISQHPLIYGDLMILASQTDKAGVVAYDKLTGEVKWVSEAFPTNAGYVSPKIVKINGEDNLVMISSSSVRKGFDVPNPPNTVFGIDPRTGKILWTYNGWQCGIPVPNVAEIGDGRLLVMGGYRSGSAMIKVEKINDNFVVTELFKTMDFGTHIHTPIVYKGHFYAHCTDNTGRQDGMTCMDFDGNIKWKTEKSPAFDKGGFILVDDLIISIDGIKGILRLIEPSPDGFKEISKAQLLETNQCWAPLALSDGKLLIRDQKQMKCVVVK